MGFGGADTSVFMSEGPHTSPLELVSWQDLNTTPALIHCEPERETEALPSHPGILHTRSKENAHSVSN